MSSGFDRVVERRGELQNTFLGLLFIFLKHSFLSKCHMHLTQLNMF